jgi:hypothetical protein
MPALGVTLMWRLCPTRPLESPHARASVREPRAEAVGPIWDAWRGPFVDSAHLGCCRTGRDWFRLHARPGRAAALILQVRHRHLVARGESAQNFGVGVNRTIALSVFRNMDFGRELSGREHE